MTAGRTAVDININLGPGFNQRTIFARGLFGSAVLDFDANTCIVDQRTPLGADLDHYRRSRSLARQLRLQARKTLDGLRSSQSSNCANAAIRMKFRSSTVLPRFIWALRSGESLDSRIGGKFGRDVIGWCGRIIQSANIEPLP